LLAGPTTWFRRSIGHAVVDAAVDADLDIYSGKAEGAAVYFR
jgi:hypothetical protein